MQSLWEWPQKVAHIQLLLVVSSCFILNLSNGLLLALGNFLPYMISYIRVYSSPSGVRMTYGTYVMAVQSVMYGCGIMSAGLIEKRLGPRIVSLIGGVIVCLGVSSSMFVIDVSFYLVIFTFGGLVGFGIGIVFVTTASCAMRWLPTKKGIASSIVCSGGGIGAMIIEVIQSSFINSHNLQPDNAPYEHDPTEKYFTQEELLDRIKPTFLILFGLCAALYIVGCIFLNNPHPSYNLSAKSLFCEGFNRLKEHVRNRSRRRHGSYELTPVVENEEKMEMASNRENDTSEDDEESVIERHVHTEEDFDLSPRQLICRPSFYILWTKFFILGLIFNFFVSLYKSFGLARITTNDVFLTTVCNSAAISYIVGRIAFGILMDLTENEFAIVLQSAIMSFLLLTMYISTIIGETMYLVWVCGVHFCIGGSYTLILSTVAVRYGEKHMVLNFGLINLADFPSQLAVTFLTTFLVHGIGWWGIFMLIGLISFVDYVLVCFLHCVK